MKGPRRDSPLDNLLRQWAGREAAEVDIERLRDGISRAVRESRFLDVPDVPPGQPWHAFRRRGFWFAFGAVAAVLLVLVLRPAGRPSLPAADRHDQTQNLPPSVQFRESQLLEKARLLAGMEETFNGRLAWVAERGRQVELGILPDTVPLRREAKPLVVRMVMLARQSGESAWKPIWQADVVARDEEVVDLAAQSARDGRLRLWMHSLPDGAIAVDADLFLKDAICVRSSFSGIQRTGVPQRVFSSQGNDAEYQVFQTVNVLPAKGNS